MKNALQAQLLKAGLVDNKKAKKLTKQSQHEQRLGQQDHSVKEKIEQDKQSKQHKDALLNAEKQKQLEEKTLKSNIQQMIKQHQIKKVDGDIAYQFIDEKKIKKLYLNQQVYNALVNSNLVIAKDGEQYAVLPSALADRIEQKMTGFIIFNKSSENLETTDEEDPYAAYVIPDDLMW